MKIHILDMGQAKYGDCILLVNNEHKILIDGGHPGDTNSIKRQLQGILSQSPPFNLDLLIITHCHSDHIGCLPALIKLGDITTEVALVADPDFGWGNILDDINANQNIKSDNHKTLYLALQEEDRADMSDDELEQFFFDIVSLEKSYRDMLQTLVEKGCKVVKYGKHTDDEIVAVEEAGLNFNLKILGPTSEHLGICAKAIAKTISDGSDQIFAKISDDPSPETIINAYRNLARRFERDNISSNFESDQPGLGAAKNNQSIVLSIEAPSTEGNWKALLAGDMQFAKTEVSQLTELMNKLLNDVNQGGPYDFIKLTHHSSYNGTNDTILDNWNKHTKLFAHTGGWNDSHHPDGGVLRILEQRNGSLIFARTDRNGLITIAKEDGELGMNISKGSFNDFSPNESADENLIEKTKEPSAINYNPLIEMPQIELPKYNEFVEVNTKVPHTDTKVSITIEVDLSKKKIYEIENINRNLTASQDRYDGLLFITSWDKLDINLSSNAVSKIKKLIQQLGCEVLDISKSFLNDVNSISDLVKQKILKGGIKGIVIIGGYDVIPSNKLDVLSTEQRIELRLKDRNQDADDFIIWSDDIYGDLDKDGYADIPVSRIPDGRDDQLVIKALSAPRFVIGSRFGVRNLARPFAHLVYQDIPGHANQMEVSESFSPQDVLPDSPQGAVYYMLHGSDKDGTIFWGETIDGDEYEAFSIDNVPHLSTGTIVFAGCCWGALSSEPIAFRTTNNTKMRPRTPDQSIALKYLQSGALAFIGVTGSHYSPREQPFNYHGKPMHDYFWRNIQNGKPPSQALFESKIMYRNQYPHGETTTFSKAIESKSFRQFTCLGLGW